jgi:uncharacterized protein (DUF433 family)
VRLGAHDFYVGYSMVDYRKIITIAPGKRSGKACIRGLRISVHDVLSMLADGMSHKEIQEDYPEINDNDILACLSYAADRDRRTVLSI